MSLGSRVVLGSNPGGSLPFIPGSALVLSWFSSFILLSKDMRGVRLNDDFKWAVGVNVSMKDYLPLSYPCREYPASHPVTAGIDSRLTFSGQIIIKGTVIGIYLLWLIGFGFFH